jgi:hypothetical protein
VPLADASRDAIEVLTKNSNTTAAMRLKQISPFMRSPRVVTDLHLRRLGPGHPGAIVSLATQRQSGPDYYQARLGRFRTLSHVTVEVQRQR